MVVRRARWLALALGLLSTALVAGLPGEAAADGNITASGTVGTLKYYDAYSMYASGYSFPAKEQGTITASWVLRKDHDQSQYRDADYWQLDVLFDRGKHSCWYHSPSTTDWTRTDYCAGKFKLNLWVKPVGKGFTVKNAWYTRSQTLDKTCSSVSVGWSVAPPVSVSAALWKPCFGGSKVASGWTKGAQTYYTIGSPHHLSYFRTKQVFKITKCYRPAFLVGGTITNEHYSGNIAPFKIRAKTYLHNCNA